MAARSLNLARPAGVRGRQRQPGRRDNAGMVAPPSPPSDDPQGSNLKSRGGLARIVRAASFSMAGLRAAMRHEAAFRQEVAFGVPLIVVAPFVAPGRWQLLAMVASVMLVLIVELLNSAIEALADAVTIEHHELLGRAKDMASAAVLIADLCVVLVWVLALWP